MTEKNQESKLSEAAAPFRWQARQEELHRL